MPLYPKMANLPKIRTPIKSPPFYHTGVDYFRPIIVKILRSRTKRWACIFTCLSTRAVHLELVESLSTDAFLNSMERFIGRRGTPESIVSDCGTNFKGATKEMMTMMSELKDSSKLKEYMTRKSIA